MEALFHSFIKRLIEKYKSKMDIFYNDENLSILIIIKDKETYKKIRNMAINMMGARRYE